MNIVETARTSSLIVGLRSPRIRKISVTLFSMAYPLLPLPAYRLRKIKVKVCVCVCVGGGSIM